ncbi:MAG: PcfJ domain-containing protein [Treponema sp.]|nr:PcfJ domain-containing protein [Treponema sp.]
MPVQKIGKFSEVPLLSLSKFFENGFVVAGKGDSGTVFLKKVNPAANPVEPIRRGEGFYNMRSGKIITEAVMNVPPPEENSVAVSEDGAGTVFFVRDFATGKFSRANFNPASLPLAAFRGERVFCPVHGKWEKLIKPLRTECGLSVRGFPVKYDKDGLFGFRITVNAKSGELIKIDYISLDLRKRHASVFRRIISTSEPQPDSNSRRTLPAEVFDFVIRILVTYTRNVYGIDISYKDFGKSQDFITAIIKSPFEPALFLLKDMFPEIGKSGGIDFMNPGCFNIFCAKIGIVPYRTLRRAFNSSFRALPRCYMASKIGITDKNIMNEMILSDETDVLFLPGKEENFGIDDDFILADDDFDDFDYAPVMEGFDVFDYLPGPQENAEIPDDGTDPTLPVAVRFYSIAARTRSNRSVWNLIRKNIASYDIHSRNDIADAARIYFGLRNTIDAETDSRIMRDGLSRYNHDLLVHIANEERLRLDAERARLLSIPVEYSDEELLLERDAGGLNFRIEKIPAGLTDVGGIMHNCVGTYADRVISKQCIIVTARRKGELVLCIEVRGNRVIQCREKYNTPPKGANRAAFNIWKRECGLV